MTEYGNMNIGNEIVISVMIIKANAVLILSFNLTLATLTIAKINDFHRLNNLIKYIYYLASHSFHL